MVVCVCMRVCMHVMSFMSYKLWSVNSCALQVDKRPIQAGHRYFTDDHVRRSNG